MFGVDIPVVLLVMFFGIFVPGALQGFPDGTQGYKTAIVVGDGTVLAQEPGTPYLTWTADAAPVVAATK